MFAHICCVEPNTWNLGKSGLFPCRTAGGNLGEYHHNVNCVWSNSCDPSMPTEEGFENRLTSVSKAMKSWKCWLNSTTSDVSTVTASPHFHRNVWCLGNCWQFQLGSEQHGDLPLKKLKLHNTWFHVCLHVWHEVSFFLQACVGGSTKKKRPLRVAQFNKAVTFFFQKTVTFRSRRIEVPQNCPATKPAHVWVVDYITVLHVNLWQQSLELPVIKCSWSDEIGWE